MMVYSMTQSLVSGPPLVVFTVCLAAFGCTMIILAHLVGEKEYPNPDIQMDWNKLFKRISQLKLCHYPNDTHYSDEGFPSMSPLHSLLSFNGSSSLVDESRSMSAVLSDVVEQAKNIGSTEFGEFSVRVRFELRGKIPSPTFSIKGQVTGKQLGLSGKISHVMFNISLSFQPLRNSSCDGEKCNLLYEACLTMSLPLNLLPKTKHPEECNAEDFSSSKFLPAIFSELGPSPLICMRMNYTPNEKLTEMLTPQDRSIVNLHLMHTSYFMFVMVMTLVCYSLVKGRFRQPKSYSALQKVPLDA